MPTMWCVCGHVLATQNDYLPYKGQFFPGDDDPDGDRIIDALAQLIADQDSSVEDASEPREQGDRELGRPAPHASLDSGMLACERCGRIWMRTAPQYSSKYLF